MILNDSIILFPVQDLASLVVFLCTFDSPILWFHEPVPLSPGGVLDFLVPLFVGVSLFEVDEFVEISEHIDEDAAVGFPAEELLESELNSVFRFEDVDHLADDILEIEI